MSKEEISAGIARYLSEVEAHLGAVGESQRRETLRQVEEHIYEALRARAGAQPTLADLEAVLQDMDPPSSYGSALPSKTSPHVLARYALAAMGAAIVLFVLTVVAGRVLPSSASVVGTILLILSGGCVIAGLALGIVAWKEPMGKAAVIVAIVLALLGIGLVPVRRVVYGDPGNPAPVPTETVR